MTRRFATIPTTAISFLIVAQGPLFAKTQPQGSACEVAPQAIEQAIERARDLISIQTAAIDDKIGAEGRYGFSVAVSVCGRQAWAEGFGYADLENRVEVTPETKFRIGSVSKTLTATALGMLVDEGKLDLDAPVQTYVPDFPEKPWPVTSRQLAGHLAGVRHYKDDEFLSAARYETVSEALNVFKDDPLVHEPGTAYLYSSYGWNLLSAVVESASGEPFLDFMEERVFAPAGMEATVADWPQKIIPMRTRFYHYSDENGVIENAPYVDNSVKWAGGGFLSTPGDLLLFAKAMAGYDILSTDTFQAMTTSQQITNGDQTDYGVGWVTSMTDTQLERAATYFDEATVDAARDTLGDTRALGHTGGSVGGLTVFAMFPDASGDIAIAAVSNNSGFRPDFAFPVAAAFIDAAKTATSTASKE